MAKEIERPEIIVKNNYKGNKDMREIFIKMFVLQMKKDICSNCTFENVKNTEYNMKK